MLIEMHAHTAEHSSCSTVAAKELVQRVFADGLDGIVLTDHHYQWSQEELAALHRIAEVPPDFLIMSGQETLTDLGDVLVYGADRTFPRGTPVTEIRQSCPDVALVWAHPYRNSHKPSDQQLQNGALDAIEIFNSNHTVRSNTKGLQDWHRLRFTATAGTDTHAASYAGLYPTLFFHPLKSIAELAGEIRHGRCIPFLSEISHFGASAHVVELQMGRKEGMEPEERVIIKRPATQEQWRASSRSFAVMEALAARGFAGGQFRAPTFVENDMDSQTAVEEALVGQSLYDALLTATRPQGVMIVRLAAEWLARMHNCRLVVTPADEFVPAESRRMERYVEHFTDSKHPHASRFREIVDAILEEEMLMTAHDRDSFLQGHGDYHPKNIRIGGEKLANRDDIGWIAAIDFDRTLVQPPAFDVGSFLAQFRNQFFEHREVLRRYPERLFIDSYLGNIDANERDFLQKVQLFKARANLSIASYLISIGLGNTEKLWRVLVEAERGVAMYRASRVRS